MKVAMIEVTLLDYMGSDLSVVNAARVSFEKASEWEYRCWGCEYQGPAEGDYCPSCGADNCGWLDEGVVSAKDAKLIKYLADHEHTSPFNHAFLSFRVKAPIFVARQLVKHKFLPWNEVSRRYVDSEPEFWIPSDLRERAENKKQGSGDTVVVTLPVGGFPVDRFLSDNAEFGLRDYQILLKSGVCPEQARMVLPQNTMTEWIWSGSLGAFADMCRLRLDSHSQKETREVAEKVAESLEALFPVSFKALIGDKNDIA